MIRIAILFLLAFPVAAKAQQARVLSGDHPGFTRLTVPMAADAAWTVGRTQVGYGVRIDGVTDVDLSRAYRLIGTNRVSAITFADGVLSLAVACRCTADAFVFRDRHLVIDIRDGAPDQASLFEQPFGGSTSPRQQDAPRRAVAVGPGRMVLPLAPGTVPVPVATLPPRASGNVTRMPPTVTPGIAELEREVVDTLARAASQGLLDLAPDLHGASDRQGPGSMVLLSPEVESVPDSAAALPDAAPGPRDETTPGLLARTSLDMAQDFFEPNLATTRDGARCWPSDFLEPTGSGAAPQDFATTIGQLRKTVSDERDRAVAGAVAALAKGYMSFGFGQEAIQVLEIDGVNDRERVALRAMAEVVDDLPQSSPDLAAQIGCPGATGLWAVLASGRVKDAQDTDPDLIAQQFKLLPDPLQAVLGPRLADLLRRADLLDTAETVLVPVQRLEAPPNAAAMAQTDIALDRGAVAAATRSLMAMAADDPRMTPDALVQLVDLQMDQKDPVSPEILSLLETMQFEYRNQPVVAGILRARTAALAYRGDLAPALALLPRAEAALEAGAAGALRSGVVAAVTAGGDDMMFLDLVFRPAGAEVAPDVQNAVAARLLALGFPDHALDVLAAPASGSVMAERRYLRASAAMAIGDPDLARSHLVGVTTPRAVAILAGEDGTAAEPAPLDTAWRSGDWATLAVSDDTLLQEAAALERDRVDPAPDTAAPLASGRALVEDAIRARTTLETLMSRFAPPS